MPSISDGYAAIARGDLAEAERLTTQLLIKAPNSAEALVLAATIAERKGDREQALSLLDSVADGSEPPMMQARAQAAMIQLGRKQIWDAIARMEAIRARWPEQLEPAQQLAEIYTAMGLGWEARPHQFALVRAGRGADELLLTLADRSWPAVNPGWVDELLKTAPDDIRPHIAQATMAAAEGKWDQVLSQVDPILAAYPEFLPAFVLRGRALQELGNFEELDQWASQPLPGADQHPDYWIAVGLAARARGQLPAAARGYWEAAKLDPDSQLAHNELMQVLDELGRSADAERFKSRADLLVGLRELLHLHVGWQGGSQRMALRIAERLAELGRYWEAVAWANHARRLPADPVAVDQELVRTWRSRLSKSAPRVDESMQPALALDLSEYPLPSREQTTTPLDVATNEFKPAESLPLQLVDQATASGLQFAYDSGDDPSEPGLWIWQTNGGGVAVVDYDLDGWPDVYLSQAGGKAFEAEGNKPNQLFRNRQGSLWTDVTAVSHTGDRGYAQGVCSGDIDSDGFPDLLVANIGRLTLLRNNGDGTFTDCTEACGLAAASSWATSVAIADLDRDGHADIYVANYCNGREPFTVRCAAQQIADQYRACMPTAFAAAPDRVYRGRGDGTFEDVSQQWLEPDAVGRGLGLIIANLDESPGLEVFVANDMTANLFWVADRGESSFHFADLAAARGLAFDHRGRPQACMGVAAADPDHDLDLDLVVTNFYDEANNYYVQRRTGRYEDRSTKWGLAEPSQKVLGFGVQWADFDNNGELELLVSNGHIDDFSYRGVPFDMPAQLFTSHSGPVELLDATAVGPYFESTHVGRSLATLDWNRDGADDALVVHLFEPVALLTNQTSRRHHWVGIELVSTSGQRDAIGAAVTIKQQGRSHYQQLIAGNGYQCSNEKVIRFGLGDDPKIDGISVVWPDGTEEQFGPVTADEHYLLIEGTGQAVSRSKPVHEGNGDE